MAYGVFNVGGGASNYDLDMLAGNLIAGHVEAPLVTSNGDEIAARDGTPIIAYAVRARPENDNETSLTSAVAGLVRAMEMNQGECLSELYGLMASVISGVVYAPLLTADGQELVTDERIPLAAVKKV